MSDYDPADKFTQPADAIEITPAEGPRTSLLSEAEVEEMQKSEREEKEPEE